MGDNWISKKVQGYVSGAGNYVGGAIQGVGNGVNNVGKGIGDNISNQTRYWGQGVSGYGNDIKDASKAGGPRVATAGNPLGLSGAGSSKGLPPVKKTTTAAKGNVKTTKPVARPGTAKDPLGLGKK
ncbi:hypothetical protein KVT40_008327 [Elsinoe batatas]|uniref:Uncharacterized protein n=1 Tax=Elsinoe batatas TaxID=2601811 RepID=A0A8K0KSZ3_9PEZI|nr:hypothetical protein KVT40_008327 [Elsinoe batatas]